MDNIEITKPKEEIKNMIDKTILTQRMKLFNLKLKNKKRQNSALNIHRSNILDEKSKCKTMLAKDSINIDKEKKIFFRNYKNLNYDTKSSLLFNNQYKKKNKISITQRVSDSNSFQKVKFKENNIRTNKSVKEINTRLKSDIEKVKKMKRCSSNYGRIIKYPIDQENFSKNQLRKKKYLDKYLSKEFSFQKQLLRSKRNEVKDLSEIEYFNQLNSYNNAEREFDMILNIQRSNSSSKFISNLITMKQMKINNDSGKKKEKINNKINDLIVQKIKKDILNAKYNLHKKRKGITEISLKKIVDMKNEEDMKKLSFECANLSTKRKKLENKRRYLILNGVHPKNRIKGT